jgi:hypothetical protein
MTPISRASWLADGADALQQVAVLLLVHQGYQAVPDLQLQHVQRKQRLDAFRRRGRGGFGWASSIPTWATAWEAADWPVEHIGQDDHGAQGVRKASVRQGRAPARSRKPYRGQGDAPGAAC